MQVREIMTKNVEAIQTGSTIKEAAEKMKRFDVGAMPVFDDGEAVGILTDRDITIRAVAEGHDPTRMSVKEVMTKEVIFCREDESVEYAADLMKQKQVRRLLIKDSQGKVVGILSLGDIATRVEKEQAGETIRQVSHPSEPNR